MIKEPDTLMLIGFMGAGKTTVGKELLGNIIQSS